MDMNPLRILETLIEFPTYQEKPDEIAKGMKDCSSFLSGCLENLGFSVSVDELFNVTAEKEFCGEKSLLINTHFDTVPPAKAWKNALEPTLRGDKLYGLGSSDAKGGIAATLAALSQMEDCRFERLVIQFVNFEDNSITYRGTKWLGMPYFLSKNRLKVDYGINVEPTVVGDTFTVSIGCTGRLAFDVTTMGKEAHSSKPKQGRNAIYDMAKVIRALRQIPPGRYTVEGQELEMPINVALIRGGRAINIVPGECRITCERRLFPNEGSKPLEREIRSTLKKVEGVTTECRFKHPVQLPYAICRDEEIVSLVQRKILETLGYAPPVRIQLGRTDSTYLYHEGAVKTVIVGPGHTGHIENECIHTGRLFEFSEILKSVIQSGGETDLSIRS
ncbi:MAG: M20/M25/M40 family metallo-hydrolase [Candidatus Bathyarchaeota archaeon]|jgi:acetylornithine deacetylase/succinyl-diaminopimelate desuccinylase-like protein|nr:M20/M25/M40 family metallo-hydrolase [Candidatus Bathyarchaeota archaeon]